MTSKEKIEIIQARENGKKIQYNRIIPNMPAEWTDIDENDEFDFNENEYRIKPKSAWRKYSSIQEFQKAMKIHGPSIRLVGHDPLIPVKITSNGIYFFNPSYQDQKENFILYVGYSNLIEDERTRWEDGTVCGMPDTGTI